MNKMNKKGFTIVELVIVIAVIAILAGVLIPTFGGIIDRANESAEMQKVAAAYKEAYALAMADDGKVTAGDFETTSKLDGNIKCIVVSDYEFDYASGDWNVKKIIATENGTDAESKPVYSYSEDTTYTYAYEEGAWTVKKASN